MKARPSYCQSACKTHAETRPERRPIYTVNTRERAGNVCTFGVRGSTRPGLAHRRARPAVHEYRCSTSAAQSHVRNRSASNEALVEDSPVAGASVSVEVPARGMVRLGPPVAKHTNFEAPNCEWKSGLSRTGRCTDSDGARCTRMRIARTRSPTRSV